MVLIGADSLDTVKKTHSHYFSESAESLLSDLEQRLTAARSADDPARAAPLTATGKPPICRHSSQDVRRCPAASRLPDHMVRP